MEDPNFSGRRIYGRASLCLSLIHISQDELQEIAADSHNVVYVVHCSDKYGDSGLISVIILKGQDLQVIIDSFLMSCRVMGRKLEDVILNEIAGMCNGKMCIRDREYSVNWCRGCRAIDSQRCSENRV